jgi:5-methylcytosine-specific restriction endonuclease McrA
MDTARESASRLASLLRREHGALADFLLALADFDSRRLWIRLGHSSLFVFLHRELGLSKGASHFRKVAAELVQRFPEVIEPLRDGRLCLTAVVELARVITPDNRTVVLPRFFHASKMEAKAVAAEILPAEVIPRREVVTAVPAAQVAWVAPPPALPPVAPAPLVPLRQAGAEVRPDEPALLAAPHAAQRTVAQPLTADAHRLHVTVSKRFLSKLEAARDALSHSHPGAAAEEILEAGLDLLLERAARRRGLVKKPRTVTSPPAESADARNPRQVPAAVRREVFTRDEGKCQWAMADGGICGSTHRVELDHILPVGKGGKPTVANLRVLCDFHNDLAAREAYGDAWMDRFTRRAGVRPPVTTSSA